MATQNMDRRTVTGVSASVDFENGGRDVKVSFVINRDDFSRILDRWTFNSMLIFFNSGDKSLEVTLPKIEERVSR